MNAGSLSKRLLPFSIIEQILDLVSDSQSKRLASQLCKDICVAHRVAERETEDTLSLLIDLGLVKSSNGLVEAHPVLQRAKGKRQLVGEKLVRWLSAEDGLMHFADAVQFDPSENAYFVRSIRLPWSFNAIVTLMLQVNVFSRKRISDPHWRISNRFVPAFLQAVKTKNELTFLEPQITIENLKNKLEKRDERAEDAEAWVLDYERRRLAGHPLLEQVRQVSVKNASAGYDIVSFSSISKLQTDRFIEVKSFLGRKRFYWSRNEIEKARQLGESYFIYLVDMENHRRPEYSPDIMSGPYSFFFQSEHDQWDSDVETYVFTRRNR